MFMRAGVIAKFLCVELLGSLVWFPVWWYSRGIQRVVVASIRALQVRAREYGLRIWFQNLFVPMYGQEDITGRLISVFIRFAVLGGKLIAFAFESVVYLIGMIAWLLAPLAFLVLATMSTTS